jgi:hypothetical protein
MSLNRQPVGTLEAMVWRDPGKKNLCLLGQRATSQGMVEGLGPADSQSVISAINSSLHAAFSSLIRSKIRPSCSPTKEGENR